MRNFDFTFKQFGVHHDKSALKVGTDAVLLGAWADCSNTARLLDIGSGCGVIALAIAQRTKARIEAIEIDHKSWEQSKENFEISTWANRLHSYHTSLQNFKPDYLFDHIVSNPPYFENAYKAPDNKRNNARHTDELSFQELLTGVNRLLDKNGKFSVILPLDAKCTFVQLAKEQSLFLHREMIIHPKKYHAPNRIMMEFRRVHTAVAISQKIHIRNHNNTFADIYKELTRDYYLKF